MCWYLCDNFELGKQGVLLIEELELLAELGAEDVPLSIDLSNFAWLIALRILGSLNILPSSSCIFNNKWRLGTA